MIDLYAAGTSNGMPNVTRWADEMTARPAIQRALKF